ncbi:hypothetical protein [Nitrospira sp. Kam-Ns4a]
MMDLSSVVDATLVLLAVVATFMTGISTIHSPSTTMSAASDVGSQAGLQLSDHSHRKAA